MKRRSGRKRQARRPRTPQGSYRTYKMTPEVYEAMQHQREAFREKFGRDPGPEDPVFFDPDADTPQPMDPERYDRELTEAMVKAGIDPALIYAYRRTGLLVTERNYNSLPEQVREEWEAALAEYEERMGREPS